MRYNDCLVWKLVAACISKIPPLNWNFHTDNSQQRSRIYSADPDSLIDSLPFANKFEAIAFRDFFDCLEHLGSNRGMKSARSGATLHNFCYLSSRVSKVSAAAMKKIFYHHSALPKWVTTMLIIFGHDLPPPSLFQLILIHFPQSINF
jgi:hypothetical protein